MALSGSGAAEGPGNPGKLPRAPVSAIPGPVGPGSTWPQGSLAGVWSPCPRIAPPVQRMPFCLVTILDGLGVKPLQQWFSESSVSGRQSLVFKTFSANGVLEGPGFFNYCCSFSSFCDESY